MRTQSLGRKLTLGFGLCTLLTALLCGYTLWQVSVLGQEQDHGATRARDAMTAMEAAEVAEQEYSIIADLIINRNLEEGTKDWAEAKASDQKVMDKVEKLADTPEEKESVRVAIQAWHELTDIVDKELFPALKEKVVAIERLKEIDGRVDEKKEIIGERLRHVAHEFTKESEAADEEFDSTRKSIFVVSIIFGVLAVLAAALTATVIIRSVTSRIRSVADSLSEGSKEVSDASVKIAETGTELSSSVTEQASAIQETVAAVDEVNATVKKNADNAIKSFEASKSSSEAAGRGKHAIDEMMGAIGEIDRSNQDVSAQIMESNRKIAEITQVIAEIGNKTKVINDIVFQTKLLSFNASVEAARAGEQGKGFAVVAEEVGNLATMSGNAAKEISELLEGSIKKVEDIVKDTTSRVEQLTSMGKEKIRAGTETANRCGQILGEIVTSVSDVARLVEDIASASQEQARGVSEIAKAMGQLDQVTHQNTVASERTATAGRQLSVQAQNMAQRVGELREVVDGSA